MAAKAQAAKPTLGGTAASQPFDETKKIKNQ
jgi:hypothetical protein